MRPIINNLALIIISALTWYGDKNNSLIIYEQSIKKCPRTGYPWRRDAAPCNRGGCVRRCQAAIARPPRCGRAGGWPCAPRPHRTRLCAATSRRHLRPPSLAAPATLLSATRKQRIIGFPPAGRNTTINIIGKFKCKKFSKHNSKYGQTFINLRSPKSNLTPKKH